MRTCPPLSRSWNGSPSWQDGVHNPRGRCAFNVSCTSSKAPKQIMQEHARQVCSVQTCADWRPGEHEEIHKALTLQRVVFKQARQGGAVTRFRSDGSGKHLSRALSKAKRAPEGVGA